MDSPNTPVCLFADEKMMPRINTTHVYGIASPKIDKICITIIPRPNPKNINKMTTVGSSFCSASSSAPSAEVNVIKKDMNSITRANDSVLPNFITNLKNKYKCYKYN
jgi:hypothetical protein